MMDTAGAASASDSGNDRPPVAPQRPVEFAVFISYRHVEPDRSWAKWLHSALETYRVPRRLMHERGLPRRIGRVFRDEEELAASSDLSTGIRDALDRSEHLIVVCSPRTPSSRWVGAEVDYFRQQGRGDTILALLIEGEPADAFPAALAAIRPQAVRQPGPTQPLETIEPLAADMRPDRSEGSRHRKRMAKLRLLAAVLHCRFDQLRQREQERRIRALGFAVSGLIVATAIVLGLGVFAELNRERATAERNRALQNQSLLLARLAHQETDQGNAVAGMLLALEALPTDIRRPARPIIPESVEALYDAMLARRELAVVRPGGAIASAGISADGQRALTVTKAGAAQLWDRTGAAVATLGTPGKIVRSATFSPDYTRIVTWGDAGPLIWDGKLGTELAAVSTSSSAVAITGFSPDGKQLVGSGKDGTWLWDAESGKEVARLGGEVSLPPPAFSTDGTLLLTFESMRTQASLWNATTGERIAAFPDGSPTELAVPPIISGITGAALSADGSTVLTWSGLSGSARVWPAAGRAPFSLIREPFSLGNAVLRPDGAQVVTFSPAGPVRLWDAKSGRELAHLADDESGCSVFSPNAKSICELDRLVDQVSGLGQPTAVFSPNLRRLVTNTRRGLAHLFDTATGAEIADLSAEANVRGVRFSPAGSRLVTFGTPAVLWDSENGRRIAILRHDTAGRRSNIITSPNGSTNAAAFAADGLLLVTAGEDGSARLWSAVDGAAVAVLRAHTGPVTDAVLSRDGHTVLTLSADESVRLWDTGDGTEVARLRGHRGEIKKLAITPDGTRLVTLGEDRTVRLWDLQTGRQIAVFGGQGEDKLVNVALDATGEHLVTSSSDGTARVWSTGDGAAATVLHGHNKSVSRASFSPDGGRLLTVEDDYTARLWRLPSGEELAVLRHEGAVESAQFCAKGATIVTAARGRSGPPGKHIAKAYLWDAGSGQQIATLNGPDSDVRTIALTPDGTRALGGYANGAGRIWDCRDGHVIVDLPQQENFVAEAEFTDDGQRLVTVAYDRVAHLYAADLSREIARLEHRMNTRHAFVARNGNRIMTLSNGFEPARIWNGLTGKRVSSLEGHTNFVVGGALSPDGSRALTYSQLDGTARLWDTETGRQLALLRSDDRVDQGAFLPDGAHVLLASHDGTIWIFPVYRDTAALVSHARAVLPRGFAPGERTGLGLAEFE